MSFFFNFIITNTNERLNFEPSISDHEFKWFRREVILIGCLLEV